MSTDLIKYIEKQLRRKITVTEGNVSRRLSRLEVTINKQINMAMKSGDYKAFAAVMKMVEKVDLADREGRSTTPLRIIIEGGLPDT